jgi:hypothetical protein
MKHTFSEQPVASAPDPLWVNSSFSTKELQGKLVRIEWMRGENVLDTGIYRMEVGTHGHSRRIQRVHGVLAEGLGSGLADFDFDQTDADVLHRSNENPKKYEFVARLDRDRPRRQNSQLERLVQERRVRKAKDVSGGEHWEPFVEPVLKPAPTLGESLPIPKSLDTAEETF